MSLDQNTQYLESNYERFQDGTADEREAIIEELKLNGFIDEAGELEQEEVERHSKDEGSEEGVDKFQDK